MGGIAVTDFFRFFRPQTLQELIQDMQSKIPHDESTGVWPSVRQPPRQQTHSQKNPTNNKRPVVTRCDGVE
jgi:hypothetical protein